MLVKHLLENNRLKFKVLQKIARMTRKYQFRWTDLFLRFIYDQDKRQIDHFQIIMPYDSQLLINVDTASFLEWYLFFYGYYEPEIVHLIKRLFRPGFVAFDVGANIGCHTLIMSSCAGGGKVVAVEPHPAIFERLIENIQLNRLNNIKPLQCAFSDKHERLTLYAPEESDCNKAKSSFYPDTVSMYPVKIDVEVNTLDEIMLQESYNKLDFLKIDTEGHEFNVLLGAEDSIKKYRPYIVFEYDQRTWKNAGHDFSQVMNFFAELKYSLASVHNGYFSPVGSSLPQTTKYNLLAYPSNLMHNLNSN